MRRVAIGLLLAVLVPSAAHAAVQAPDPGPGPGLDVPVQSRLIDDPRPDGPLGVDGLPDVSPPEPPPAHTNGFGSDGDGGSEPDDGPAATRVRHQLVDAAAGDPLHSEGIRPGTATSSGRPVPSPDPAPGPASAGTFRVAAAVAAGALAAWLLLRGLPDDPTRRHLLRLVRRRPGRNLSDLAEALGVDRTTVRHHVDVLADDDLVTCRRVGRCRRVFPAGAEDDAEHADLLDHPIRQAIVRLLRRGADLDQRRLRDRFGVAASTVTYHAKRLEDDGLVERTRRGRRTVLELTDRGRDVAARDGAR